MIKAGAVIDVPTRGELRSDMGDAWREYEETRERVRARGVKLVRLSSPGPSPAASSQYLGQGPDSGYIWAVRLLSVQLATAGTVLVYVSSSAPGTSATPQRLIANLSTSNLNQVQLFATAQAMLYPDESLWLSATQTIAAWFVSAWEVPAEMEYKLL
jgi:hypothetical protein